MACKIDAKFDDLLEKVKDTLLGENFTLNLSIKTVCCDNMDVLTGETGYFPLI